MNKISRNLIKLLRKQLLLNNYTTSIKHTITLKRLINEIMSKNKRRLFNIFKREAKIFLLKNYNNKYYSKKAKSMTVGIMKW